MASAVEWVGYARELESVRLMRWRRWSIILLGMDAAGGAMETQLEDDPSNEEL